MCYGKKVHSPRCLHLRSLSSHCRTFGHTVMHHNGVIINRVGRSKPRLSNIQIPLVSSLNETTQWSLPVWCIWHKNFLSFRMVYGMICSPERNFGTFSESIVIAANWLRAMIFTAPRIWELNFSFSIKDSLSSLVKNNLSQICCGPSEFPARQLRVWSFYQVIIPWVIKIN